MIKMLMAGIFMFFTSVLWSFDAEQLKTTTVTVEALDANSSHFRQYRLDIAIKGFERGENEQNLCSADILVKDLKRDSKGTKLSNSCNWKIVGNDLYITLDSPVLQHGGSNNIRIALDGSKLDSIKSNAMWRNPLKIYVFEKYFKSYAVPASGDKLLNAPANDVGYLWTENFEQLTYAYARVELNTQHD